MPEGYSVQLTALEDYIGVLTDAAENYEAIHGQLAAVDLTAKDPFFDTLLGHPQYAGAQSDFTEACRTMLTKYAQLYSELVAVHHEISGKLNYMVEEFVETHSLYARLEDEHAEMFTRLLDDLVSEGGDNGAAGQG